MCPVCLAAAAATWIAAGSATAGVGGLGALALARLRPKARPEEDFQLRMQPEDEGEPS
jgi:hypothetical protein